MKALLLKSLLESFSLETSAIELMLADVIKFSDFVARSLDSLLPPLIVVESVKLTLLGQVTALDDTNNLSMR